MPAAWTWIKISPALGDGMGSSAGWRTSGPPNEFITIAFMVAQKLAVEESSHREPRRKVVGRTGSSAKLPDTTIAAIGHLPVQPVGKCGNVPYHRTDGAGCERNSA